MKTMYICECCGKLFEHYEDCSTCENGHYRRANISEWTDDDDMKVLKETLGDDFHYDHWKEGQEMPDETIVKFTRSMYTEGTWKTEVYYQRAKVTGSPFGQHFTE